jgi:hypothetical protein
MSYDIPVWVGIVVIVLSVWRALHGPSSDETWHSFRSRWWRSHRPPPV